MKDSWRRSIPAEHWKRVLIAAAVLFAGRVVSADEITTATLHVTLRAAPGITGTVVASPVLTAGQPARVWQGTLDHAHDATIHQLPPGAYLVEITLSRGGSVRTTVVLDAGHLIWLDVRAPTGAGPPTITALDQSHLGQGIAFRARDLRDLPAGNQLWALLDDAAPFVIADRIDDGGLGTGVTGLIGTRGASWTSTDLSFDNVDAGTTTQAGVLPLYPDLRDVESLRVYSGLNPPEIGTPGAVLALAPKRPGSTPEESIDGSFSNGRMVSTNDTAVAPEIARLTAFKDLNVQGGAPINGHTGLFVSATTTGASDQEGGNPLVLTSRVDSALAHLVSDPTPHDEIRVVAALQAVNHPFADRLEFANPDVEAHDLFLQSQLTWDHTTPGGGQQEWTVGYQHASSAPNIASPAGGVMDTVFDGPIPLPPASAGTERLNAKIEYSPHIPRAFGDVRLMGSITHDRATSDVLALPTVGELVDGLPARVWVPSLPSAASVRSLNAAVGAINDELTPAPAFTLDLGLRVGTSAGSAAGAAQGADWKSFDPRTSFRWAPDGHAIFGGFARYSQELTTDLLAPGDPGEPAVQVYAWNDANGNDEVDPGEEGPLIAQAGLNPGVASIDPKLRAPHTNEFTLGYEQRFTPEMTLSLTAVVRNEHNLVGLENVGVPITDYTVDLVPNQDLSVLTNGLVGIYNRVPSSFGQDRYLLTNLATGEGRYRGLELLWNVHTPHWSSAAGASAFFSTGPAGGAGFSVFENDQGVIGDRYTDPNNTLFLDGHLFFDRSYVLKWSTSYRAPHGFVMSVTARYQDGQPFSRTIIAPDLAQGPEAISVAETGTTRFTFEATIDTRLEERFRWGRREASIRLDAYNLTNRANEIEENPVAGPLFRETTAVQPPRTLRLGFHLDF